MKFMHGDEFTISLRTLYQKGAAFQKAAQAIQAIWGRAKLDDATFDHTFHGVAKTNHGENRIPHCTKYDLTGFARLVTVVNNNICLFLFAGDHDTVDAWLERNRGLDFVAKKSANEKLVLEKVRISPAGGASSKNISGDTDLSEGALFDFLPKRYQERMLSGLEDDTIADVKNLESIADDGQLENVAARCGESAQQNAMLDVLLSLRSGDIVNAKNCIDLFTNNVIRVNDLDVADVEALQSSSAAVLLSDVDPELFAHFVQTASFERWMLYLHPAQREYVDREFSGPARMSGVSGSGKTCVVIHRALRLADKYADENVLIVTLSPALAMLISRLIDSQRGVTRPTNLKVKSIFDLCFEKLMQTEPNKRDYYTKRTVARNPHAVSEHIDEVWREYYMCENNNADADSMLDVVQLLNQRGIYANDYLRQEFDYVRSSFAPADRDGYLQMDRMGRIVPFIEASRRQVLEGLVGWERKMAAVGAIDDMGIVASLYCHLDQLKPEYRCTLVDEVQDLGTLELAIVRRLTHEGENDIFLCGDAAQTIYTKSSDVKAAGINTTTHAVRLNQNYRNSRQILTAAHDVLTRAIETMPKGAIDLEILEPEYASFSSPKPLLLRAESLQEEIERGLGYLNWLLNETNTHQRYCLAICGYPHAAIEAFGSRLSIPVLNGVTDIQSGRIFLSDLEQMKGFEFDTVVVINCAEGVLPHPNLPVEESFRDLCRLYVAMTRAKTQLLMSFSGQASPFLNAARESFVEAAFALHAERMQIEELDLSASFVPKPLNPEAWGRSGVAFLKSADAIGLDKVLQEEILAHVTGTERYVDKRQLEWKTFGAFAKAMENARTRQQVISEGAWSRLEQHLAALRVSKRVLVPA